MARARRGNSDLALFEPEPWPYPVNGADLLAEIVPTISICAVVADEQARTAALWIVASHAFLAFRILDKNGRVGRIVGEDMTPKTFSVYCPAVIDNRLHACDDRKSEPYNRHGAEAGQREGDPIHRQLRREVEVGLACKVARFAAHNFGKLASSDPVIPEGLRNRKGDNWRPLFAVADLAGGAWPTLGGAGAILDALSVAGHIVHGADVVPHTVIRDYLAEPIVMNGAPPINLDRR
jgi:hypothetical protein